jgi:hypothetical protein
MNFPEDATPMARRRFESRLWDVGDAAPHSMGCQRCIDRDVCGMLRISRGLMDCTDLCCGSPDTCTTRMCRRSQKEFVRRHMEIDGFELQNVPSAPLLEAVDFPAAIPMIYHGSRRTGKHEVEAAALKLSALYDRNGYPRFLTRQAVLTAFKLTEQTKLVVSGIDQDHLVERWWQISKNGRARVIKNLQVLGVQLVSVPNFSLAVNWPRWSDLYSIKRIALTWQEFAAAGIPVALHPNGRTERDFERWRTFISARPAVQCISYEFSTGTGRAARGEYHVSELIRIAKEAGRPLHLFVIGGQNYWPMLAAAFAKVTVIDTSIFMKTMHRQRALAAGNWGIRFQSAATEPGAPLDDLLADNLACIASSVAIRASRPVERHG